MEIDKTLLGVWKKYFKQLSKAQVADDLDISRQTINNALNGHCSQKTHDKINAYLLQRKNQLKDLIG